ncbi:MULTISPECIES: hypothetical protein [Peribacillus]|uniref:hypothetical protein n=1 Tax=Peribacillus TaxID=2675229 RepID=UPI001F4D9F3F|nr:MULTISPECIES: hypothetical protein [unclassified Peribacillus]MCK1983190.1 hypothetical protein [Peribacillus sp. Aquil_B1]MCK2006207.1 hypothetical protein [Peribacillus sp. Aquil_B8]
MLITVLSNITDKEAAERLSYQKSDGKLISKNEAIFFDGNDIYYALVKPTKAKGIYIVTSGTTTLAENVKITDKNLMLDQMEEAINRITVRQISRQNIKGNIDFELIESGTSEVREF